MNEPNLINIEAVNRSSIWSSYNKHISIFSSIDYAVVSAISRVLGVSVDDNTKILS